MADLQTPLIQFRSTKLNICGPNGIMQQIEVKPNYNYTPVKCYDCILHYCHTFALTTAVRRQKDRHINTGNY